MDMHCSRHPSPSTAFMPVVPSIDGAPKTPEPDSQPLTKPTLRLVLKTILLKDYYSPEPSPASSAPRLPLKRMKDSDDYITARGANPRTGLISPSVGTRTPCTPDSPGDALKLCRVHASPSTVAADRRASSKASQGRKISAGTQPKPHAHGKEVSGEDSISISSDDDLYDDQRSACSGSEDDRLVHMPSANEPQPFAYPGYSQEQIEAFEHYKHKARRTSSDGYDRRLKNVAGKHASLPGGFESYDALVDDGGEDIWIPQSSAGQAFKPYRHSHHHGVHHVPAYRPTHSIAVRKMNNIAGSSSGGSTKLVQSMREGCVAKTPITGAKSPALLSPPFTSPKTCAKRLGAEKKRSAGGAAAEACWDVHHHSQQDDRCSASMQISSKKVPGAAPRHLSVAKRPRDDHTYIHNANETGSRCPETLGRLPRVRLLRDPEVIHRDEPHPLVQRQCSLGCPRDVADGQCLERRKASTGTIVRRGSQVPDEPDESLLAQSTHNAEIVLGIFHALSAYVQRLRVPKSALVETLVSPDASTRTKAEALTAVLSLAAHVVAACTLLAVLWKLGVALMHLLEVLLWPLAMPLRVLRWIGGWTR